MIPQIRLTIHQRLKRRRTSLNADIIKNFGVGNMKIKNFRKGESLDIDDLAGWLGEFLVSDGETDCLYFAKDAKLTIEGLK